MLFKIKKGKNPIILKEENYYEAMRTKQIVFENQWN